MHLSKALFSMCDSMHVGRIDNRVDVSVNSEFTRLVGTNLRLGTFVQLAVRTVNNWPARAPSPPSIHPATIWICPGMHPNIVKNSMHASQGSSITGIPIAEPSSHIV